MILRELSAQPSPLERRIWHSYDDRAYWSYYENRSKFILYRMFKVTDWKVISRSIGSEVQAFGSTYNNPRVVKLRTISLEEVLDNASGVYSLTILDPWQNEPVKSTENYLHMLNISWSNEFQFVSHSSVPQRAPRSDLSTFLEWKNDYRERAPTQYSMELALV